MEKTGDHEIRFVSPTGSVGGGISETDLQESMSLAPHFIACDAGTTDAGPFSLGSGLPAFAREAVKHDLALMLKAGGQANIPVIVGSAGTAGGDIHVDWVLDIAREVVREENLNLRTAVIYAEQDKQYLKNLLRQNRILPLDPAPPIDDDVIDGSSRIVGMMGVEPIQAALRGGAQFVLAGRSSDSALFAALPIMRGFPPGMAWHAGKVSECGTLVCEKLRKGVIFTTVRHDEVTICPVGRQLRCTPQSVAAHSLYETTDPYLHRECSGTLDLRDAQFVALDERTVAIRGTKFLPETYTVKLEGAELVGYQSIIVGGIRDPYVIRQLDSWLSKVQDYIRESVTRVMGDAADREGYTLNFHKYGINAVMRRMEPEVAQLPHEVGIVSEATAPTQAMAHTIAELSRQPLLHYPPGVDGVHHHIRLPAQSGSDRSRSGPSLQPASCGRAGHPYRNVPHPLCRIEGYAVMILAEIASLIRSKNAGPFSLTFDILFTDQASYRRVLDSGALSAESFARLYHCPAASVRFFECENALAFKFSIPRPQPQGALGDGDTHGGQQFIPLMTIEIA